MTFSLKNKPITWTRISQLYKAKIHKGIDLAAPTGTPIYATADGTVVAASYGAWDKSYGNMVAIYHGGGTYTNHAHLSKIKVKVGKKVKAGDLIGLCGSTGNSTGSHLHFEVHLGKKWNRVDPKPYIDNAGKSVKKVSTPTYTKGKMYTLQEDMNVRMGSSIAAPRIAVSKWTKDAQKHATKAGLLKKGTKVTCKAVVRNGGETWLKIPSGYVCAINAKGKVYIK